MALLTLDMQELCGYLAIGLGKSYEANPGPRLHADTLNIGVRCMVQKHATY